MKVASRRFLKGDVDATIEHIDAQIDELLAEMALEKERVDGRDDDLEDLYYEAGALKERMQNVVSAYRVY